MFSLFPFTEINVCMYVCMYVHRAKFGWPPGEPRRCSIAKTRNSLKFAGVPQTGKQISAVSGPKFTVLCGHVEELLLFNNFFRVSIHALRRCSSTKLCDGAQTVNFWRFFAFCIFSEPRAAHFRPAS